MIYCRTLVLYKIICIILYCIQHQHCSPWPLNLNHRSKFVLSQQSKSAIRFGLMNLKLWCVTFSYPLNIRSIEAITRWDNTALIKPISSANLSVFFSIYWIFHWQVTLGHRKWHVLGLPHNRPIGGAGQEQNGTLECRTFGWLHEKPRCGFAEILGTVIQVCDRALSRRQPFTNGRRLNPAGRCLRLGLCPSSLSHTVTAYDYSSPASVNEQFFWCGVTPLISSPQYILMVDRLHTFFNHWSCREMSVNICLDAKTEHLHTARHDLEALKGFL